MALEEYRRKRDFSRTPQPSGDGTFEWVRESAEDFGKSRAKGDLKFRLQGQKLHGEYALVHTGARGAAYGGSRDGERNWLMIKKRDDAVVEGFDANTVDVSVKTG